MLTFEEIDLKSIHGSGFLGEGSITGQIPQWWKETYCYIANIIIVWTAKLLL